MVLPEWRWPLDYSNLIPWGWNILHNWLKREGNFFSLVYALIWITLYLHVDLQTPRQYGIFSSFQIYRLRLRKVFEILLSYVLTTNITIYTKSKYFQETCFYSQRNLSIKTLVHPKLLGNVSDKSSWKWHGWLTAHF